MVCSILEAVSTALSALSIARERSSKISRDERDDAVSRLEVYRDWFSKEVMQAGKYSTIVVNPIENISPRYRDEAT